MSSRWRVCLVLWSGFVVGGLAADPMTMDDLVQQVIAHHPGMAAVQAGRDSAQAAALLADRRPNPEFSTEGGLKQVDAEGESESGYVFGLSIGQPIERHSKREARQGMAAAAISLAELDVESRRREIEADVRHLAMEYYLTADEARTIGDAAARNQALLDLLKQRPIAGSVREFERVIIEASLVSLHAQARDRKAAHDQALMTLNQLLGRAIDSPLELAPLSQTALASPETAELISGFNMNPRRLVAEAEQAKLEHEAEATRLETKSDYVVGPFISHEDAGEQELSVGLSLSMALPWRTRVQDVADAVDARLALAQAEKAAVDRQTEMDFVRIQSVFERTKTEIEKMGLDSINAALLAEEQAERQYRLGVIPFQLYLDVQQAFLDLYERRQSAWRSHWEAALSLYVLTGVMPGEEP